MQRFICLLLGVIMALSNISCAYDYAIGTTNLGPTTLVAYPFELYPGDIPLSATGTIGGVIDDYSQNPDKYLDIYWMEEIGSSKKMHSGVFPREFEQIYWGNKSPGKYNKFHVRLDMTLPPQFTPRTGDCIDFWFYKGNILVTYTYTYRYGEKKEYDKRCTILANGTPTDAMQFVTYMQNYPNATTNEFVDFVTDQYHEHLVAYPDTTEDEYGDLISMQYFEQPQSTLNEYWAMIEKELIEYTQYYPDAKLREYLNFLANWRTQKLYDKTNRFPTKKRYIEFWMAWDKYKKEYTEDFSAFNEYWNQKEDYLKEHPNTTDEKFAAEWKARLAKNEGTQ